MGYNALLTTGFIIIQLYFIYLIINYSLLGSTSPFSTRYLPKVLWVLLTIVIIFAVIRNLPIYPLPIPAP